MVLNTKKTVLPFIIVDTKMTINYIKNTLTLKADTIFVQDMKVAVLFLLFLGFFLLTGHADVHSEVRHHNASFVPARYNSLAEQTQSVNFSKEFPLIKNNSLSERKDDATSIENEDDEENSVFSRKISLITNYFVTLAALSLLSCFFYYIKNRLPFCSFVSYTSSHKYILQRVLRI